MSPRRATRWRWGLSVIGALLLGLGAASTMLQAYYIHTSAGGSTRGGSIARGAVFLVSTDNQIAAIPPKPGIQAAVEPVAGEPRLLLAPSLSLPSGPGGPHVQLRLPLWIPALLTLVPAAWLWRGHLRRPRGRCAACGYDVRGIRGDRCPECGRECDMLA